MSVPDSAKHYRHDTLCQYWTLHTTTTKMLYYRTALSKTLKYREARDLVRGLRITWTERRELRYRPQSKAYLLRSQYSLKLYEECGQEPRDQLHRKSS
eukprot:3358188-Rhodomonas_salina.1